MFRPGTEFASKLLSSDCEADWSDALSKYDDAVSRCAFEKNSQILRDLDLWWRGDLHKAVESRTPRHITHEELQKIMRWKITRGKDRPMLINLVKQNSPETVIQQSADAFLKLSENNWECATKSLAILRGVGPATASAILAPFDPVNCPFMADEVLESTTKKKREYTTKAYYRMRAVLITKATKLSGIWTAELVGRALWAHAVIASSERVVLQGNDLQGDSVVVGSKRRRMPS